MKILLSTAIIAASVLPTFAFAVQSNTVTFKGEVSTQTCDVSINGEKTSPVVLLPTVADTQLASAGATAADTNFTIDLTNCNDKLTKASAVFVGNNVTTSGNLGNTGTSTKVSIQLKDGSAGGKVFDFNSDVSSSVATIASGTGSIPFIASYYAEEDGVAAGTVVASAQYAINYE